MSSFFKLEKPAAVREAAEKKRGLHWALELLVFVAVFLVGEIAEMFLLVPGNLILLFTNADYIDASMAGDIARLMEISNQVTTSETYTILSLFATLGMILIAFLFCRILQKRPLRTLGFRREGIFKEYIIGIAAGFLVFSAAVLICVVTGALELGGMSPAFSAGTFLLFTVGFMIQGMSEEVLCRGYFMVSVARRYPLVAAIMANSLFFAALHLLNPGISVLALLNLVLFGVFASVYFLRRGNIWGVAAFHSVWNLVQGNFYGIRVSGMEMQCSVLQSDMVAGKEIWNGGAFGLEGGLAVTIVYVVGIAVLLCMKGKEPVQESQAA
ncbi:MAG: CPBP family intramembrane metalloprotease [Acetatifactor sp.]|nr:CPBP family intramembrane metalloprotease [Acetatifactor sp.]